MPAVDHRRVLNYPTPGGIDPIEDERGRIAGRRRVRDQAEAAGVAEVGARSAGPHGKSGRDEQRRAGPFRRIRTYRGRVIGFGGARPRPTADVTVAEAAEQWLRSYVATTRNPKGQRLALVRVNAYLLAALGSLGLRELTGDHVRQYRLY